MWNEHSSINSCRTTEIWKKILALLPTNIRRISKTCTIWWTDIFDISIGSANCRCEMCWSLIIKAAILFLFTRIKFIHDCPLCGSDLADVQASQNFLGHHYIILFSIRTVPYKPSISSHICLDVRPQWTLYRFTRHCSVLKFTLSELIFNKNSNTQG